MKYCDFSDEELLKLARKKDADAVCEIIERYKNLVKKIIRSFYIVGGDYEDLLQEGYVGLYKAIATFDENNEKASFKNYASACIKNRIISIVKKYSGNKNLPLNTSVSLSQDDGQKIDIPDNTSNPEENYLGFEGAKELVSKIKSVLSPLENEIFDLYLLGYSYSEIGEKLCKNEKSIDNAVQRIRKKIALKIGK